MPRKYAVAFVNFSDNDLTQTIIEADSPRAAIAIKLLAEGWDQEWVDKLPDEMSDIQQTCFDCDCLAHAIQV